MLQIVSRNGAENVKDVELAPVKIIVIIPHWYETRLLKIFPLNRRRGDCHARSIRLASAVSVHFYVNNWTYDRKQAECLQRTVYHDMHRAGELETYRCTISFTEKVA